MKKYSTIGFLMGIVIIVFIAKSGALTRIEWSKKKQEFDTILKKTNLSESDKKNAEKIISDLTKSKTYRSEAVRMHRQLYEREIKDLHNQIPKTSDGSITDLHTCQNEIGEYKRISQEMYDLFNELSDDYDKLSEESVQTEKELDEATDTVLALSDFAVNFIRSIDELRTADPKTVMTLDDVFRTYFKDIFEKGKSIQKAPTTPK